MSKANIIKADLTSKFATDLGELGHTVTTATRTLIKKPWLVEGLPHVFTLVVESDDPEFAKKAMALLDHLKAEGPAPALPPPPAGMPALPAPKPKRPRAPRKAKVT